MKFTGRAAAALVAVAAGGALWYFTSPTPVDDTAAKDGARVFCLEQDQRLRLADASATLQVTIPDNQLRDGQGPEFDRVCSALTNAVRVPQLAAATPANPVKPVLTTLLPVVAGAALTWFAGFWRDERTQSLLLADALQAAARRYRSAVYVEQQKLLGPDTGVLPVDSAVLDARDELAGQLRKAGILRAGWLEPDRLRDRLLNDRLLGADMNRPRGDETVSQLVEAQRDELRELGKSIDKVVAALEKPWQWHGDMRRKHVVVAEGAIAG